MCWIRTGSDKQIKTTDSRTRLNIVGAIRLGHLQDAVIEQYEKTVNGESIIDFFKKVRAFYPNNCVINLILDGAGYHRSGEVKEAEKSLNQTALPTAI